MSWTTLMSTPAARARVAAPWRRSCRRIGGSPASAASVVKVSWPWPGAKGVPSGSVNSSPVWSTQTSPWRVSRRRGPLMGVQHAQSLRVEGNGAFPGVGLRFAFFDLPADLDALGVHSQSSRWAASMSFWFAPVTRRQLRNCPLGIIGSHHKKVRCPGKHLVSGLDQEWS
jgi:hypothetical protein